MTSGPWYKTSICNKLHGKVFEAFIINSRTDRYNIMCSIDAHEREINHPAVMMAVAVGFVHYQQIQQQKHYNFLVQL